MSYLPDAPLLSWISEMTTENEITVTWTDNFEGGYPILDYQLFFDQGIGNFT